MESLLAAGIKVRERLCVRVDAQREQGPRGVRSCAVPRRRQLAHALSAQDLWPVHPQERLPPDQDGPALTGRCQTEHASVQVHRTRTVQ